MADYKLPSDYNDVQSRIAEFREKHPNGSLQQVALDFREVAGTAWVVYTAAAYRSPDDERPGMGTAWERVPGKTNFTRDSELQNAETAAWGRAIVASLAADTKKGIASAEEIRNRIPEPPSPADTARTELREYLIAQGIPLTDAMEKFTAMFETDLPSSQDEEQIRQLHDTYLQGAMT